jgi:hypothetical protein
MEGYNGEQSSLTEAPNSSCLWQICCWETEPYFAYIVKYIEGAIVADRLRISSATVKCEESGIRQQNIKEANEGQRGNEKLPGRKSPRLRQARHERNIPLLDELEPLTSSSPNGKPQSVSFSANVRATWWTKIAPWNRFSQFTNNRQLIGQYFIAPF